MAGMEFVTIPNVELLEVGENWMLSTGPATFTAEDIASAVDAQSDPSVRTPIIKFGHTDPRFDGQPSIGRIENMWAANNGQTLVGDYVGVPKWLAEIMPSAYPRRSVEGNWDWETYTGNRWPFYLTALALLGEAYPGISTIEDIKAFFEGTLTTWIAGPTTETPGSPVEAPNGGMMITATQLEARPMKFARAGKGRSQPAATVEVEDVRRQYYDYLDAEQPGSMWWWIRAIQIDPAQLIVDDDEGHLWRVGYTISGDTVTFATPIEVKVVYEDTGGGTAPIAAAAGSFVAPEGAAVVYATRGASRPGSVTATNPEPAPQEATTMTPEQLEAIGLTADATPEQITARLAQLAAVASDVPIEEPTPDEPTPDEPTPDAPVEEPAPVEPITPVDPGNLELPDGTVLVDRSTFEQIAAGAAAGAAARETQLREVRDQTIAAAVKAGKIAPARAGHWKNAWDKDAEGTRQALASLEPGLIPVTEKGTGHHNPDDIDASAGGDAYPSHWFPEAKAARRQTQEA